MLRYLRKNDKIILTASGLETEFTIEEVLGGGASCIAYKVSYKEDGDITHKAVLKEFFPAYLLKDGMPARDKDGGVIVRDCDRAQFDTQLVEFKNTYRIINEYISQSSVAVNYHPAQIGLYYGNNTAYTLTARDYGKSYDKTEDKSLEDMFSVILALARAVGMYHSAGFVHLDIKPQNLLVLDGVTDIVKLFDYDSLTPIEKIRSRQIELIPQPGEYHVPELAARSVRRIGVHTDIFEIGATAFYRIFGRYPGPADMSYDSRYNFEGLPLFKNASPVLCSEVETLLRNTVQTYIGYRYQDTDKLCAQLEKIIDIASSNDPYLINLPAWQPTSKFVGREYELSQLDSRLEKDGYVFVKGIGGLGKSELVKYYVSRYAKKYHTVQFCKYDESLKSLTAALSFYGVDEKSFTSYDELVRYKNGLLHICDERTLIIVDNFNVTHDKFLREFLPVGNRSFKVIFTTRCTPAADYYQDKVLNLSKLSMPECKRLFSMHCEGAGQDMHTEDIISMVDFNTLVITLLAKTMKKSGKSPQEILSILQNVRLDKEQSLIFHEYDYPDDQIEEYNKINSHLNVIFDISRMSECHKQILKNMSLVCHHGIAPADFIDYCKDDNFTESDISELVTLGWLDMAGGNAVMHPIVSDLMYMNARTQKSESYYNLAQRLESICEADYTLHVGVIMQRLATALHLERRYMSEGDDKNASLKYRQGRLYMNLYRPAHARSAYEKALGLFQNIGDAVGISVTYYKLGEVEMEFGTLSDATLLFQKAINLAPAPERRIEPMLKICECLSENGKYNEAYDSCVKVLSFALDNSLDEYIYETATLLTDVCYNLDMQDEVEKYTKLADEYKRYARHFEEMDAEILEVQEYMRKCDYEKGLRLYETFLAKKRVQFGEDSPVYQTMAKYRWNFYLVAGYEDEAKRYVADALAFVEKNYGAQSMEMAEQLCDIAGLFPRISELRYSIDTAKRALEICNALGQGDCRIALESRLWIASGYALLGDIRSAKEEYAKIDFSGFSGTEIMADVVCTSALILIENSEYDTVEKMCLELLKKSTIPAYIKAQTYLFYAIVLEHKGLIDQAEHNAKLARLALGELVSGQTKVHWYCEYARLCARLCYRRGEYDKAVLKISEIIDRPEFADLEVLNRYMIISERALYYTMLRRTEDAMRDYELVEQILNENNMDEQAFIKHYNNISVNLINVGEFEKAREYINKIIKIKPEVLSPEVYIDCMICGNLGWIEYSTDNPTVAEQIYEKLIPAMEKIGVGNTFDFANFLNNYGYIVLGLEKYQKAYEQFTRAYDVVNSIDIDMRHPLISYIRNGTVLSLAGIKKYQQIFEFMQEQDELISQIFGEYSSERIDFLIRVCDSLVYSGRDFCDRLFEKLERIIESGNLTDTVQSAYLQNYIGVRLCDIYEQYSLSLSRFKESKKIFETANATDDPMYPTVISNIEYAQQKIDDKLIADMANAMPDEQSDEED